MTDMQPILVDTKTACRLLGIKKTLLFQYLKSGDLERHKIGRKTLIPLKNIQRFAERGQV
ncbi:helix-turn-helix domain-containing protein [Novosphingobium sp. MD-1]|uniref:helix-turn-helix domain-containing protein n=1 Tax=Novosphingobium sp. MD-1 TaxID=1630648 RepID=UPI000F7DB000|nr:helix-turn-helix domain-containing protein [Novosphingobium sp. MD-1]